MTMMNPHKCSYFGNPWLGMFVCANEELALLPPDCPEKVEERIRAQLGVETRHTTIAGSNLAGLYVAMNSSGIILPNVATDSEVEGLRKTGLNIYRSEEKNNAHGNNIAVNDRGGIINEHVGAGERKNIGDALGVELVPMKVARYVTVGSCVLAASRGFLAHYSTSREELDAIEGALKVKGNVGTVNTGAGFVAFGAIANARGYIVGEATTAYEMGRIEEALGFL